MSLNYDIDGALLGVLWGMPLQSLTFLLQGPTPAGAVKFNKMCYVEILALKIMHIILLD